MTLLGKGGMASVYLGRNVGSAGFERLAAVKLMHRNLTADEDFVTMFLDEARVAARLHHPNVAAIIDLGAEGSQLYTVMDYVQGDTLDAAQRAATSLRRSIPLGIVLRVVMDALAGLDAAHELRAPDGTSLNLIHRDATPHNILIGVDGAARLVDFGIARAECRAGVTSVGVLKGKAPFMAPEQLKGRSIDRRADVFSMGVTLWESIGLRRCFPLRDGVVPRERYRDDAYRPLRTFAPHVPEALDAICRRALAIDPADRFATAAAFAEALDHAFRADIATQRQLGQFISVVAADKIRREREAVREAASIPPPQPATLRPGRSAVAASVIDLRPPRTPRLAPPVLDDFEAPTAIVVPKPPPMLSERPTQRHTMPPPPPPAASVRPRHSASPDARARFVPSPPAAPSPAPPADANTVYEVATAAFSLTRARPSVVPISPRSIDAMISGATDPAPPPTHEPEVAAVEPEAVEVEVEAAEPRVAADQTMKRPVSRLPELSDDELVTFEARRLPKEFREPPPLPAKRGVGGFLRAVLGVFFARFRD
ncbi:MAG: serine/threonine-protein kinase [Polyangiales bacterium]